MISVVLALMTFFDDVVQCLVSVLRDSTVSSRLSSIFRRKLGALVSNTEVKPEKVGWCCCCITSRSGWLLELLTELIKQYYKKEQSRGDISLNHCNRRKKIPGDLFLQKSAQNFTYLPSNFRTYCVISTLAVIIKALTI